MRNATNVRDTSIDAYYSMGPKMGKQQAKIVAFLAKHAHRDFTRAELAGALGLPVSSICGRTAELIKRQIVVETARRPDRHTGIAAHGLQLAPAQGALFS